MTETLTSEQPLQQDASFVFPIVFEWNHVNFFYDARLNKSLLFHYIPSVAVPSTASICVCCCCVVTGYRCSGVGRFTKRTFSLDWWNLLCKKLNPDLSKIISDTWGPIFQQSERVDWWNDSGDIHESCRDKVCVFCNTKSKIKFENTSDEPKTFRVQK